MKKILFADLDDTLFQTLAKLSDDVTLKPVAYYSSGEPCSYSTEKQRSLFDLFDSSMLIIPTTARDIDAFKRVHLNFKSYAICNFGGVVLHPDGQIDDIWITNIKHAIRQCHTDLHDLIQAINDFSAQSGYPGRAKMIEDCGIEFYIVVKDPEKKLERLVDIENSVILPWLEQHPGKYFIHRNANNLSVVPVAVNKSHAVAYVRAKLEAEFGPLITFGMGDSNTDAKFMSSCDYAISPQNSQLSRHMEKA